jgi:hypothetical protein
MKGRRIPGVAAALAVAASAAAPAGSRVEGAAPVLGRLEHGLWQLRPLDGRRSPQPSVCLGDPEKLAQLQHVHRNCSRRLVASARDSVTLSYECPAIGSGHTVIRVETPRLARIESQGLDNGVPFAFRAEARRIGPCR